MKKDKKLKDRYGAVAAGMEPYQHHLDLRGFDDLDDDVFAYIMAKVKGVNMLDLNEAEITNGSISLISKLEYVKELRAKGCHLLDDGCVADLDKITSLEFLHLRYTAVTIDGLLKLKNLTNLKTLMFSADDAEAIKEKLLQLKTMLPNCELVINAKPYAFNAVELFVHAINKKPYRYKLKIKDQPLDAAWSNWLIHPSDSYIEVEAQGPYSINDIEWVEIDALEKKHIGKLVPENEVDHSTTIIKMLDYLSFPYMQSGYIFSVYLVKKNHY